MIHFLRALGFAGLMRGRYNRQSHNPVVFVPGLYGSMGDTIIPGTGDWNFGISSSVYEPFIEALEEMGYVKGENLFIAYYDWRKDCEYTMNEYLKPTISLAKKVSRTRKVDIICHSMGGLVTRTYLQSQRYKYDVEKTIFIATPHAGAANAYSFWTEGKLLSKKNLESQLFTLIIEGYLWILSRLNNYSNELDAIHDLLPGVLNLLPSKDYGDYLYFFDENKNMAIIPYEKLNYPNAFLDRLNDSKGLIKRRKIETTLIVGNGIYTNEKFQIYKSNSKSERIISVHKTNEGDGTVTQNSASLIEGDTYIFNANHTGILQRCIYIVREKLGISEEKVLKGSEIVDSIVEDTHVSILIEGKGDVKIYQKNKEITKILYDGSIKEKNVFIEDYDENYRWLIIKNVNEKEIVLDYEARENDIMDILITSTSGNKVKFKEHNKGNKHNYRFKIH